MKTRPDLRDYPEWVQREVEERREPRDTVSFVLASAALMLALIALGVNVWRAL